MYHTVLPPLECPDREIEAPVWRHVGGVLCELRPDGSGKMSVARIVTTDLSQYLRRDYSI